jgi:prepilin signal peptidase PulO-like enzyme (type II secretory pathway)
MPFLIIVFIYGTLFGSFGNVVAYRILRGESIFRPRSHCPACHMPVPAYDLLPVVNWMWLLGRCRHCRTPIPLRYPLFELVAGALFAVTYLSVAPWPQRMAWMAFWVFLLVLVQTDLLYMRVPNLLTLSGVFVFVFLSALTGVQTAWMSLLGGVVSSGMLMIISLLSGGRMGLGDVKLYGSIGAMLGPWLGLESLCLAALSGTVIGLLLRLAGHLQKREYMAFVPHIAIGVVLATFYGQGILQWYITRILGLA